MTSSRIKIVMIGGSGAVGTEVIRTLVTMPDIAKITLLGRREHAVPRSDIISQHVVDLTDPSSYTNLLKNHDVAICTLGIGEPSKATKEQFIAIDKDIPIGFANECKSAGGQHFQLLSSVAVSSKSKSFFLRVKGELEDALKACGFRQLSLFHPSMILTPNNRYGFTQALTLAVWPKLNLLLQGPLRKYRGVKVEKLGTAIALNSTSTASSTRVLEWDDFG